MIYSFKKQEMKPKLLHIAILYLIINCLICVPVLSQEKLQLNDASKVENLEWITFNWVGDSVFGAYFDKLAMNIPVSIDDLPYRFYMQLDLGVRYSKINKNSIAPYLIKHTELEEKRQMIFDGVYVFKSLLLKLDQVSFGLTDLKQYDPQKEVVSDSIDPNFEKRIGTLGTDLFSDKVLIIDYRNQRLAVVEEVPTQYADLNYKSYKRTKDGRVKFPFLINGKKEYLLFDTGSSMFPLLTSEARAREISNSEIVDSVAGYSWKDYIVLYGRKVSSEIKLNGEKLQPAKVYYEKDHYFDNAYKRDKVWGITGNKYFLDKILIIDYRKRKFTVL